MEDLRPGYWLLLEDREVSEKRVLDDEWAFNTVYKYITQFQIARCYYLFNALRSFFFAFL